MNASNDYNITDEYNNCHDSDIDELYEPIQLSNNKHNNIPNNINIQRGGNISLMSIYDLLLNFYNNHFEFSILGINFWELLSLVICIIIIISCILFNGDWVRCGFPLKIYIYILLAFWFFTHIINIIINFINNNYIIDYNNLFIIKNHQLIIFSIVCILFIYFILQKIYFYEDLWIINPINFGFGIAIIECLRVFLSFIIFNLPEFTLFKYYITGEKSIITENIIYFFYAILFIIIYLSIYFLSNNFDLLRFNNNEEYSLYCLFRIFYNLYNDINQLGTSIIYIILLFITIIYKLTYLDNICSNRDNGPHIKKFLNDYYNNTYNTNNTNNSNNEHTNENTNENTNEDNSNVDDDDDKDSDNDEDEDNDKDTDKNKDSDENKDNNSDSYDDEDNNSDSDDDEDKDSDLDNNEDKDNDEDESDRDNIIDEYNTLINENKKIDNYINKTSTFITDINDKLEELEENKK